MNEAHIVKIAGELKVQPRQVLATAKLFAEGATVPFIARYRKEATGSLDEVAITSIRERLLSLAEFDQRRETILKSLEEQKVLTDALKSAIAKAETISALEDIYQPYRPKRRTRATIVGPSIVGITTSEISGSGRSDAAISSRAASPFSAVITV